MSNVEVKVPDIGDFKEVEIIELMVKVGDTIKVDQSLVTVESDKASMEIPSSHAGVIKQLRVKVGDKIAEGSLLLILEENAAEQTPAEKAVVEPAAETAAAPAPAPVTEKPAEEKPAEEKPAAAAPAAAEKPAAPVAVPVSAHDSAPAADATPAVVGALAHASPSIRKFARELGVDLIKVPGSGQKGRITQEDVQNFVKGVMSAPASVTPTAAAAAAGNGGNVGNGSGLNLLPWPALDFTKFGPTEIQPLSRIQKLSGPYLHRNWVMIPHVTQFDEADITELEEFRIASNAALAKAKDTRKLTMLAFVIKASVAALKKYPAFNSSIDATGENLILKQYYNIGFAADTPNGLMVPVIKDVDKKGFGQIAQEMADLSFQAREGKLRSPDMQGATFTISSLGGIGGTAFTPIINAPEVAILGLSKAVMKPVWDGKQFVPRLMMPLSLSYDHRVIDGAMGARFAVYLADLLGDMRKTLL